MKQQCEKDPTVDWIGLDWNALFRVDKIIGKKNPRKNSRLKNSCKSPDPFNYPFKTGR